MEVVPTGDGDDDGVVWFRCPQCQGFLPKLSGMDTPAADEAEVGVPAESTAGDLDIDEGAIDGDLILGKAVDDDVIEDADDPAVDDDDDDDDAAEQDDKATGGRARGRSRTADREESEAGAEPVLEYAAMLAAVDPATAVPYRPWESYEVGQCVLHLAWDDCGVVVAKELLPGGRQVVKCWFQGAGVVRLIENAPR